MYGGLQGWVDWLRMSERALMELELSPIDGTSEGLVSLAIVHGNERDMDSLII